MDITDSLLDSLLYIERELSKLTDNVETFPIKAQEKADIPFELVYENPEMISHRYPVRLGVVSAYFFISIP